MTRRDQLGTLRIEGGRESFELLAFMHTRRKKRSEGGEGRGRTRSGVSHSCTRARRLSEGKKAISVASDCYRRAVCN